jgi:hypothetical protein
MVYGLGISVQGPPHSVSHGPPLRNLFFFFEVLPPEVLLVVLVFWDYGLGLSVQGPPHSVSHADPLRNLLVFFEVLPPEVFLVEPVGSLRFRVVGSRCRCLGLRGHDVRSHVHSVHWQVLGRIFQGFYLRQRIASVLVLPHSGWPTIFKLACLLG